MGFLLSPSFLVGLLAITAFCTAQADEEGHTFSDAVVQLTDESFAQATSGHAVVMYYAPWCGWCKRLTPLWSELAEKKKGGQVVIAAVDATTQKENAGAQFVQGFPTLLHFHGGEVHGMWAGERDLDSLVRWVDEVASLTLSELVKRKSEFEAMQEEQERRRAEEKAEQEKIDAVVGAEFDERVVELTDANFGKATAGRDAVVMVYADWCGHCKRMKPEYIAFAAQPGVKKLLVARLKGTDHRSFPGAVLVQGFPTVIYYRSGTPLATFMSGDRTVGALRGWAREMAALSVGGAVVAAAEMEEEMRERAVEAAQREREEEEKKARVTEEFRDVVLELTDDNFDTVTAGRPVIFMAYADWCGHCNSLKPTFAEFARTSGSKGIAVGRLLATEHRDNPSTQWIEGFPTILVAMDGKIVDAYKGARTLAELQAYAAHFEGLTAEQAEARAAEAGEERARDSAKAVEEAREEQRRKKKAKEEEMRKAKLAKRRGKGKTGQASAR